MENKFEIPVVLFIFKRKDATVKIINQIKKVAPKKLYLIADAGRNEEEKRLVSECRTAVENAITWPCEIIKNYASENRGVHAQIGLGAMWVFEREEKAIFLEDDNLPAVSFFRYCEMCLEKYENDPEIFWICGTNYLQKCQPKNSASVFKSQHLLPCGWASWAKKFNKYYDADLHLTDDPNWKRVLRSKYKDSRLFTQQRRSVETELNRKQEHRRYNSWDFHQALTVRMNDFYAIVPMYNQIENIGVDEFTTHQPLAQKNSFNITMTQRFCGIKSYELPDTLNLPDAANLSDQFETKIGKIILYPFKDRVIMMLREKLNVPENVRLRHWIMHRR